MYLVMLAVGVAIFALTTLYFLRSPASSWFHPLSIYLAFHGLVFTFRPFLSYFYDYRSIYRTYQFEPSAYDKIMTLVVANLGLVAFAIGALAIGKAPMQFARDRFDEAERDRLRVPLLAAIALIAPLAAYSTMLAWQGRITGELMTEIDFSTGINIQRQGNGYVSEAQLMLVPLTLLFAWLNRFKLWSFLPLAAFIFFRAGTGGRGPIVAALAGLACFYLYGQRQRWPNLRALATIAAAALLFTVVGADRGRAFRELIVEGNQVKTYQTNDLAPLEGMDLGMLEFVEYLVTTVPRKTGTHEYFVDQLQFFTEPIPRALWKDKPAGQPIRLFSLFDYGYPIGMTRSLAGEGWTQLGLLGVAFWCGLWGAAMGWIYQKFASNRQTTTRVALYCCFLPALIVFYRDGLPITLARQLVFYLGPVLLVLLIARLMSVPSAAKMRAAAQRAIERNVRRKGAEPDTFALPRSRRQRPDEQMIPRAWRSRLGAAE